MKAEHKYRALIHQSPDPIFVSRIDDFAFTDVNERACANYGYSQKEFLNMEIFDIETKAPLRQQVKDLYEAIEIGEVVEVDGVNRRKDGTIFPVHVRFTRLDDEYAMATVRDIAVLKAVLQSGALEWVRDITPTSSVPRRRGRGRDRRPPDLRIV